MSINININADLNDLLKSTGKMFTRSKHSAYDIKGGGRFIGGEENGIVFSCCFHPTKEHSASVIPGNGAAPYPRTKQWVPPGQWAITYTNAGLMGNKSKYDIKE
ncbi:hypothetical protein TVAG_266310 [Trichomonas vaginalis G3]|uniref:Uncharacterized protein n=1 Tax=Trichomonas vaginalis (strain ATCC PRA-98 / G3) TaxID=412133 RepID=A2DQI4_TRIV3|nr:hypothetical protein TVAGG3_0591050 [Trichomonas vaginalis G3]EAY17268.1 hypothetical protein TVAG_266310 [Trichomonas vaginalis G3]KAI5523260.1 hypothetical protein TVAGG3_0591050 [Trichomonas vaginalis G3]|eukprot:XP_001329491.1 hypothetical protein [Trichomonas vaginalis G3]